MDIPARLEEIGHDTEEQMAVRTLLRMIGEDPDRDGLKETPKRFCKALLEMTEGLRSDPKAHLLKTFAQDEGDDPVIYGGVILSGPLPFVSLCEHHLALFDGHAWIAYIPGEHKRVVGLSKLARLLDGYAKRPQVQERLTQQIANAVEEVLQPIAAAVLVKGRHSCQCFRGVKKDGRMLTQSLTGAFLTNPASRGELMDLVRLSTAVP